MITGPWVLCQCSTLPPPSYSAEEMGFGIKLNLPFIKWISRSWHRQKLKGISDMCKGLQWLILVIIDFCLNNNPGYKISWVRVWITKTIISVDERYYSCMHWTIILIRPWQNDRAFSLDVFDIPWLQKSMSMSVSASSKWEILRNSHK